MALWREEYLSALAVRDQAEKANVAIYDAYTRLADRTGGRPTTAPPVSSSSREASRKGPPGDPASSLPEILAATRADLAEAQRSRSQLQDRLTRLSTEAEKLRKRNAQDSRRLHALEGERTHLQLRLKDRDEELKGKAKLLEDFQDEMATLNLQLNMAEDKVDKLKKENQDLIDRWMARMGKEADAMNDASKFA
ncbi:hypothetical protein ASPZODRAFT_11798 [Penicilliopsis zonata CBS 506.65]|uniref:Autophagy-related protein 16 domain-containing protein n=1 Tax=Penicilliopsis zonata CBS 506.65 TaxID=1073090 RepID=A0A1L9SV61_9EURO|nr:hypothetical protein ASPZODRAFT_11798 [Penicilliopsis zonata CBS 506.65]OJJ50953.1 hypothetical protein ASPZODRAFT_11798 [Penicilliopsis zonata CBS 506.65]